MAEPLISLSKGISNGNVEILEKEEGKNVIILLKSKSQKVGTEYFKTFFSLLITKYIFSGKRSSSQIILGGIAQDFSYQLTWRAKQVILLVFF